PGAVRDRVRHHLGRGRGPGHRDRAPAGLRGARLLAPARRGGPLVHRRRGHPGRRGRHGGRGLPGEPRRAPRPDRRPPGGVTMLSTLARLLEGIGIALDSIRANKVRAALTILGIAIGVMVVVGMAAAITGINHSVTAQLEAMGPKTFFVYRFFEGGINISDGSDETSPWRRRPFLKVEEAQFLRQLPAVREVA